MDYKKMKNEDFLFQCQPRIDNTITHETMQKAVAKYGYTPSKMAEGKLLLDRANKLNADFYKYQGKLRAAFAARNAEKEKAKAHYRDYVNLAQVALKNNYVAQSTLELDVRKSRTHSGWVIQTKNFYRNLLKEPAWLKEMAKKGVSKTTLRAGLAEVEQVEKYAEIVKRAIGEAKNATKERNKVFKELSDWITDFEVIVRIAMAETPQLLEMLGIVVKS
jgi:hypothetical protein